MYYYDEETGNMIEDTQDHVAQTYRPPSPPSPQLSASNGNLFDTLFPVMTFVLGMMFQWSGMFGDFLAWLGFSAAKETPSVEEGVSNELEEHRAPMPFFIVCPHCGATLALDVEQ